MTTLEAGTNWVCVRCEQRYAYRPTRRGRRALVRVRTGACPPCAVHVRALLKGSAPQLPAPLADVIERVARKQRFGGLVHVGDVLTSP